MKRLMLTSLTVLLMAAAIAPAVRAAVPANACPNAPSPAFCPGSGGSAHG